jgi:ABC-type branched-subunit amino acid transport system ATPase component
MLKIKNISLSFDGIKAVSDVSVQIVPNCITSIIGPNGAGKTTLFNLITGHLCPDCGEIYYKDRIISKLPPYKIFNTGIARTFQKNRLLKLVTVIDNILLACPKKYGENISTLLYISKIKSERKRNIDKSKELIKIVGLEGYENSFPGELSYGQQKLLTIACCLASEADLFLLDEPFAGVHPKLVQNIGNLLRELVGIGKTILFIEHDIDAVKKYSDEVIVMNNGLIITQGKPESILSKPDIIATYLE